MCHQFLSLEQEAENDNDRDRTLDNSNSLEDSNNGGEEGGDSWISFDQFRRSFSSEFSQQPQDDDDVSNLIQSDETAMNRRNTLLCIDEGKENKGGNGPLDQRVRARAARRAINSDQRCHCLTSEAKQNVRFSCNELIAIEETNCHYLTCVL